MLIVIFACILLIALTTLIHFEALRVLNAGLPKLNIPSRNKLLVVIFATFVAHAFEIFIYGLGFFVLIKYAEAGSLVGSAEFSMLNCFYFSAETYTSLGFGDLTPKGPVRLMVGIEALNGLLLIGWSASYTYFAMEQFWGASNENNR